MTAGSDYALLGDIGGTNARFALAARRRRCGTAVRKRHAPTRWPTSPRSPPLPSITPTACRCACVVRRIRGRRARRRRQRAHDQPSMGGLGRARARCTRARRRAAGQRFRCPVDGRSCCCAKTTRSRSARRARSPRVDARFAHVRDPWPRHRPGRGRVAVPRRPPLSAGDRGRPRQFRPGHARGSRDPRAPVRVLRTRLQRTRGQRWRAW